MLMQAMEVVAAAAVASLLRANGDALGVTGAVKHRDNVVA